MPGSDILGVYACNIVYTRCVQELCGNIVCSTAFDLGLPLFDALFAMIRRILRGQSPMTADRGHLHHRLVDMGFSQKQTVFILYAISGVLGITAVLLAESGVLRALLLVICVLILLLIGSMLGKNSYVHQHQDNRNLTDDNEIDVEEVSDKKGNEDK